MRTKNYTVIFAGTLTAEQVSIQEQQTTRLIDVDLQRRAEQHWQNMLTEASVQGKKIWDSQVYRFESGTIKDNQLHLQLSTE
jgi:endo-beta-N-acetylglucosaminidase D